MPAGAQKVHLHYCMYTVYRTQALFKVLNGLVVQCLHGEKIETTTATGSEQEPLLLYSFVSNTEVHFTGVISPVKPIHRFYYQCCQLVLMYTE